MHIWAASWQKPTKWLCTQRRLRSARVFAVHSMGSWGPSVSSCGQRRLWSDWADAQAGLSLRWAHIHFVGFVRLLILSRCWSSLTTFSKLIVIYMKVDHYFLQNLFFDYTAVRLTFEIAISRQSYEGLKMVYYMELFPLNIFSCQQEKHDKWFGPQVLTTLVTALTCNYHSGWWIVC